MNVLCFYFNVLRYLNVLVSSCVLSVCVSTSDVWNKIVSLPPLTRRCHVLLLINHLLLLHYSLLLSAHLPLIHLLLLLLLHCSPPAAQHKHSSALPPAVCLVLHGGLFLFTSSTPTRSSEWVLRWVHHFSLIHNKSSPPRVLGQNRGWTQNHGRESEWRSHDFVSISCFSSCSHQPPLFVQSGSKTRILYIQGSCFLYYSHRAPPPALCVALTGKHVHLKTLFSPSTFHFFVLFNGSGFNLHSKLKDPHELSSRISFPVDPRRRTWSYYRAGCEKGHLSRQKLFLSEEFDTKEQPVSCELICSYSSRSSSRQLMNHRLLCGNSVMPRKQHRTGEIVSEWCKSLWFLSFIRSGLWT